MAGEVRIQQAWGFHAFAHGIRMLAGILEAVGNRRHTPVHPVPPGDDAALGELRFAVGTLHAANDGAVGRLGRYTTEAHLGLGGMAYTGDSIGVQLPGVDLDAKEKLRGLVRESEAAAPALPTDAPGTDPRFVSLPVTP